MFDLTTRLSKIHKSVFACKCFAKNNFPIVEFSFFFFYRIVLNGLRMGGFKNVSRLTQQLIYEKEKKNIEN